MEKMRRLKIIWGLLLVVLVGALTIAGIIWKNNTGVYKRLEDKLSDGAAKYRDAATIGDNEKVKVTLEELQEAKVIEELKVNDDECDGYVEIYKKGLTFRYEPYIKCNKYVTKGYKS